MAKEEYSITNPAPGESAIPGHLANLETPYEGGAHESSPPRRTAEEERLYGEIGRPPHAEAAPLTDEELEEQGKAAAKAAAKAK